MSLLRTTKQIENQQMLKYQSALATIQRIRDLVGFDEQLPPDFVGVPQACESVAILCDDLRMTLRTHARNMCTSDSEARSALRPEFTLERIGNMQRYLSALSKVIRENA